MREERQNMWRSVQSQFPGKVDGNRLRVSYREGGEMDGSEKS